MQQNMQQRIFITGGASGLGRAIAERYAKQGYRVAIGDVNKERLAETKAKLDEYAIENLAIECDVTKISSLEKAAKQLAAAWDGVDIIVNNAGVATAGSITDHSMQDWEWVTDINLLGVVRGCKAFTPLLKKQGGGHIVNVASMAGLIHPPLMASYNATKAAVVALSETLETELANDNIGVTVVCPGFFRTNLDESMRSNVQGMDKTLQKLFERSPLTAADVADAVYQAVQKKEFFVLPHAEGRKAYLLKRALPHKLYAALSLKNSQWLLRKQA